MIDYTPAPILNLGLNGSLTFNLGKPPWTTQGIRIAISGTPGGGKSYLMSVIAEELHRLGIRFVVIDPEGEHRALGELGDVLVVGTAAGDAVRLKSPNGDWIDEVLGHVQSDDCIGAVIDLSDLDEDDNRMAYTYFAEHLMRRQQVSRQACFFFVEEAHIYAPQKDRKRAQESLRATKWIMRQGRKSGVNAIIASQRPGDLEKDALAQTNVKFFGRVEIEHDYRAIARYLPRAVPMQALRDLSSGEFYLSVSGDLHKVTIRERRTTDLGATPPIVARPRGPRGQRSIFEMMSAPESVRSMRCR